MNILIVDDCKINTIVLQRMVETIFTLKEVDTKTANSGKDAVDLAHGINFDFIFMDYMMPDMDGMAATILIRQFNKSSPIAVVTAADRDPDLEATFRTIGANEIIYKPLYMSELKKLLHRYIDITKL